MTPRKHQIAASNFCKHMLATRKTRCVVQMPTGSGKSWLIRDVARFWNQKGGPVYVLCPNEEIVHQQRLDCLREGMMPVIEMASLHAGRAARLVIGTMSTFWRRHEKHRREGSLVLIDECHHFNFDAPMNCKVASTFERAIGFSATPWSSGCLDFFENNLHSYPLSQAIRDGVNCEYRMMEWIDPLPGRYQIVYGSNLAEIRQMCMRILPSDYAVHQEKNARQTISRFRFGQLGTIVVNRMLTEGFDQPQIKRVWIARNTESPIFALQMAGRALRPYRGQCAEIYVQSPKTLETLHAALKRAG